MVVHLIVLACAGVAITALAGKGILRLAGMVHAKKGSTFLSSRMKKGGFLPQMNENEAALILGIRRDASKDEVKLAHRQLMVVNHPDSGGSDYLAMKINQAKDVLLRESKNTNIHSQPHSQGPHSS
eukprot:TRINITY_DN1524_c0_g1_i1.p1 TRINITY_DN1524_c0_g1~~TRINITY_DN1524_c0_g1_i1.p1  ORF type:complete len:126 (-),score=27.87 TRINITY_DN1524_c0_g1_i1:158-535(-)